MFVLHFDSLIGSVSAVPHACSFFIGELWQLWLLPFETASYPLHFPSPSYSIAMMFKHSVNYASRQLFHFLFCLLLFEAF